MKRNTAARQATDVICSYISHMYAHFSYLKLRKNANYKHTCEYTCVPHPALRTFSRIGSIITHMHMHMHRPLKP